MMSKAAPAWEEGARPRSTADGCQLCGLPRAGDGTRYCTKHFAEQHGLEYTEIMAEPDMVNHPAHYTRGPEVKCDNISGGTHFRIIECIEVIRHITDMRLATAMKYIWRVAFGGKDNDREDIAKAMWYLQDWLDNEGPET